MEIHAGSFLTLRKKISKSHVLKLFGTSRCKRKRKYMPVECHDVMFQRHDVGLNFYGPLFGTSRHWPERRDVALF